MASLDNLDYFFIGSIASLSMGWAIKRIAKNEMQKKAEKAKGTSAKGLGRGGPGF